MPFQKYGNRETTLKEKVPSPWIENAQGYLKRVNRIKKTANLHAKIHYRPPVTDTFPI